MPTYELFYLPLFVSLSLSLVLCVFYSSFALSLTLSPSLSRTHSFLLTLTLCLSRSLARSFVLAHSFPSCSSALPRVRLHSRISYIFRDLHRLRSRLFFFCIDFGQVEIRDTGEIVIGIDCFSDNYSMCTRVRARAAFFPYLF